MGLNACDKSQSIDFIIYFYLNDLKCHAIER